MIVPGHFPQGHSNRNGGVIRHVPREIQDPYREPADSQESGEENPSFSIKIFFNIFNNNLPARNLSFTANPVKPGKQQNSYPCIKKDPDQIRPGKALKNPCPYLYFLSCNDHQPKKKP